MIKTNEPQNGNSGKNDKGHEPIKLIPFLGFPEPIDEQSFIVVMCQAREQYVAWLQRSAICETNSQIALNERDYDYWHNLFLEAEIEATYYWQSLKLNGFLQEES